MSEQDLKNDEGQSPTRTPDETRERLIEKAGEAQGRTNRELIEKKIEDSA